MIRNLGWIAAGGIGVGIVAALLAAALSAGDISKLSRFAALANTCRDSDRDAGNGTGASERRWTWDGGDSVDIATSGTIHYRGGEGDAVIVRGAPEDIAHIRVHEGKIASSCDNIFGRGPIDIVLPGRVFRNITVAGSGKLTMENVSQPELNVTVAGSGSIQAQGASDHVTITIAGSGKARLGDLAVKSLDIHIAGSGRMEAAPQDEANIDIAGSGNVNLLTNPAHIHTNIIGSGRITQPQSDRPRNTPAKALLQAVPRREST